MENVLYLLGTSGDSRVRRKLGALDVYRVRVKRAELELSRGRGFYPGTSLRI